MKKRNLAAGLLACIWVASVQADPSADVYTKGGANPAALACLTCHGADGMGMAAAGFPRLAGLSAEYMKKQLLDFQSGSRAHSVMLPIASALTEGEMQSVSLYIEQMTTPDYPRINRSAEATSVGERLALRGAWERNIPECVACHGPGGVGVGAAFPPLAGQSSAYLSSQLIAWKKGTRTNDPNDLMGHIAKSLTDDEVKAVSDYFSGLGQ
ncbi:c-type cytochrome [Halopseudomonas sp. SMJS2]|uniref:c-type cytochrome n=1 Tax=Halopseudomonas sp. SMJS2 TaxID=3041098 RepID=UPI00245329AF|nr:c-type cytochrome [Halopseudomonas sp. SMJS2]WGK63011.1 c-type cytochrome [Halopseudomonas sp. SMJS2]